MARIFQAAHKFDDINEKALIISLIFHNKIILMEQRGNPHSISSTAKGLEREKARKSLIVVT